MRQRGYVLFWVSRFLTILAVQAQAVTIAWQVYALARGGGSSVAQAAFVLGMIGLAQFLPLFALALIAGDTADRHDRRLIVAVCMCVEIVCVGALAAMALKGVASFWPIVGLAVVFGAARAFYNPASTALGPSLVPRILLPRAIAWNSLAWQSAVHRRTGAGRPAVRHLAGGGLCGGRRPLSGGHRLHLDRCGPSCPCRLRPPRASP